MKTRQVKSTSGTSWCILLFSWLSVASGQCSLRTDVLSPDPKVRAVAAAQLMKQYVSPDIRYRKLLAGIKVGESKKLVLSSLIPFDTRRPKCLEAFGSLGIECEDYPLDNYWALECFYQARLDADGSLADRDADYHLTSREIVGDLIKSGREVDHGPPAHFTGVWTLYYVNGQKVTECQYRDGKKWGRQLWYYPTSVIFRLRIIGPQDEISEKVYYTNGTLECDMVCKGRDVVFTAYQKDGSLSFRKQNDMGTYYNRNGSVSYTRKIDAWVMPRPEDW